MQVRAMARVLGRVRGRRRLVALAGGMLAVIVATAVAQVGLNAWNEPFYGAVERKDLDAFLHQIVVFLGIAGVLLVLNVTQTGLNQLIRLTLREMMTRDLVETWMAGRRAARIGRAGEAGVNPDQRIHADAHHLAEVTTDLAVGLVQSTILLASFIGVLWVLSGSIVLPVGDGLSVPGYLVWAALVYAVSGSALSWRLGRPLVRLEASRYAAEADLRIGLVRGAEQAEGIALSGGEGDERDRLAADLGQVLALGRRIVLARVPLTAVAAGYGWGALVFPFIVAAPGYFAQSLSFGELMMVVGAFAQVQQALRWFVDNTGMIADGAATLTRVMVFRNALLALDEPGVNGPRIEREAHPKGHLALRDLVTWSGRGRLELAERSLEIAPGERVLLIGKPGTGKTTLFLAIAGMWDGGSGRIALPPEGETMFLSQRPFVPAGTLRHALTCSRVPRSCSDREMAESLERVGLGEHTGALDHVQRWDRELTLGEQERLSYARLLLNRPRWLICDDVLDPLDDANRALILSILTTELAHAAVLNIANSPLPEGFYTRTVRIATHPLDAGADQSHLAFTGLPGARGVA